MKTNCHTLTGWICIRRRGRRGIQSCFKHALDNFLAGSGPWKQNWEDWYFMNRKRTPENA